MKTYCPCANTQQNWQVNSALIVALCLFSSAVNAELYFAPELLAADPKMVANLAHFENDGAQLPGDYQVDIYINNKYFTNRNLRFMDAEKNPMANESPSDIRDNTGLMACLLLKDLVDLGVNAEAFPALASNPEGQCISPGKFIPEAFTAFDFQRMRLDVSIPQAAIKNSARGYISPERWDEGINAAILNYSFSGNNSHGRYGESRSSYLNLNGGLNIGAWRLRDYRTWNEYDSQFYLYRKWQHIKTYAERAIIPLRSELTLGDSTTSGDVFDSLGFRGIQMSTDDSMYPDSLRGFAPVIRGNARTNARVNISQNGYSVYQTFVAPGAFAIDDLYPVYSSGDLEVTVTEADDSVQTFTVPYSSVPVLQREGHLKYALTAGRYQSSGDAYSQPGFVQSTLIWGLPHNFTAYGGLQYSQKYFAGVMGLGLNMGTLGALSADVTQANSTLADGSQRKGRSLRFLYARSLSSLGTTFQLTGYRYSTQGYHTLDETALKDMRGWRYDTEEVDAEGRPVERPHTDYYNLYNNKRAKVQASISQRVGEQGAIYLSGVRQSYWNSSGTSDSLQVGFNSSIGSVNYNLAYNYSKESNQPGSNRSVFLSLSLPLDTLLSGNSSSDHSSMYASYSASRDSDGKVIHQTGLSGTALEHNNLSWNVAQGYTRDEGSSGSLSANYQGGYGNGNLGYSYSNNYRQVSYGVSGGVILHNEGLTLGQPLGETSVLISAAGVPDVAVENETGVRTDWRGYTIKPYASVYRENRVALNTASLDDYTDIDETVTRVVPTRGAVVRATFKGVSGRRVLMTLNNNGKPLPFGTLITAGERGGIVGDDGLVYLSGLPDGGTLQAEWGSDANKQCTASYRLSAQDKEKPVTHITANCS